MQGTGDTYKNPHDKQNQNRHTGMGSVTNRKIKLETLFLSLFKEALKVGVGILNPS